MIQQNNGAFPSYFKTQRTVIGHLLLKTELPQRPENRKHMPQHLKSTRIDPGWELALGSSNYQEAQTLTALKVQAAGGSGWVVKHTGENRPVLDLGYKLHQLRLLLKHESLEHQVGSQDIICSCLPVFNSCGTYQLWSSAESVTCTGVSFQQSD